MRRTTAGLLLSVWVIVVGCSNDGDATPSTTTPISIATSTTIASADDGILRIGLLTPLSGPGADIGASMRNAAELAVTRVNEAGGVLGRAVRLIIQDEGADVATAGRALDQFDASNVDAVIGPASSTVALQLLGTAIGNEMLTCSPTATAIALDDFPDEGLFFRTVPSDSLAATAMARAIDQTGRRRIGVAYVDDAYGRAYAEAVIDGLTARSLNVAVRVPIPATDTDITDEIVRLLDSGAEVVAVIAGADLGSRLVDGILASDIDSSVPVFVTDAMRGPAVAGSFIGLSDEARSRIIGVGPTALPDSQTFLDDLRTYQPDSTGFFATNTFDCVNLIALSATDAGSTRVSDLAPRMQSTASGGTGCQTFADCTGLLDVGRNVDYDGPSGILQLGATGDLTRGTFDLFGFDGAGGETDLGSITITL